MTKTKKRRIFIPITIVFLIALITILVFRVINDQEENSTQDDGITPTTSAETTANDVQSSSENDSSSENPDHRPTQYEGEDPNNSDSIDATLTYFGLQGDEYVVNINIAQYVDGTCTISLGNYTGTVAIDEGAANSACSFRINPSALHSGQQDLQIKIQSDSRQGLVEEKIDVSL